MFKKIATLLLGGFMLASSAHAEFQRIDVDAIGDQKAILDYSVGVEWLRFDVTTGLGFSYVQETGMYSQPDISMIQTLVEHVLGNSFVSSTEASFALTNEQRDMWFDLMGASGTDEFGNAMSIGLVTGYIVPFDPTGSGPWVDAETWAIGVIGNQFKYIDTNGYYSEVNYGIWRSSDGGQSLSSIADPSLNINNPYSPYNNPPEPDPSPVNSPLFFSLFGLALLAAGRRKAV